MSFASRHFGPIIALTFALIFAPAYGYGSDDIIVGTGDGAGDGVLRVLGSPRFGPAPGSPSGGANLGSVVDVVRLSSGLQRIASPGP